MFTYRIAICDSKSTYLRFILKSWCKTAIEVCVPQIKLLCRLSNHSSNLVQFGVWVAPKLPKWWVVLHLRKNLKIPGLHVSVDAVWRKLGIWRIWWWHIVGLHYKVCIWIWRVIIDLIQIRRYQIHDKSHLYGLRFYSFIEIGIISNVMRHISKSFGI